MSAPNTGLPKSSPAATPDALDSMIEGLRRELPDLSLDLFALSGRVISLAHLFEQITADGLSGLGLNRAEENVLGILRSGSENTPSKIAKLVHQSPAGMTRTLDRLERQHLIEREADSENLRQIKIRLTERGQKVGEQKLKLQTDAIASAFRDIAPAEVERIATSLKELDLRVRQARNDGLKNARVA